MSKLNINKFVSYLWECLNNKDGYIMASYGQNPKTGYLIDKPGQTPKAAWQPNGWYYTQYSGAQREKALYWREYCKRVHDCAGMVEGWVEMQTGVSVNTRARYIYSGWCDPKGSGTIPVAHRVPGAAVFIYSSSAGEITHIGYLVEPVIAGKPEGDWWIIEARGVMYGVVKTKLNGRGWNRWGLMTKYFDYSNSSATKTYEYGERNLRKGDSGSDVKTLQEKLIAANYSCGTYGADGDFGSATEEAVKAFQEDNGLTVDGIVGQKTFAKLDAATNTPDDADPVQPEEKPIVNDGNLLVKGGSWNVRIGPGTEYATAGVVHGGDKLKEVEVNGWKPILFNGQVCWVSAKAVT